MITRTQTFIPSTVNRMQPRNITINNYGAANQTNSIFQNPLVQKYDLNGDGRLSEDEMKLLMKDYNINPDETSKESGSTNVWDALGGLFSGLGNALPMGVMALFNKGGDADA